MDDQIVFNTPWFNIEEIDLAQKWAAFHGPFYRINSNDGVIILPVTRDKRLVLVKQYRPAINEVTLEFPSGTVDEGETPLQAVEREFLEETGYICENIHPLIKGRVLLNRHNCYVHTFVGKNAAPLNGFQPETGISVELVTMAELKKQILAEKFPNLTGISLLLLADWIADVKLE